MNVYLEKLRSLGGAQSKRTAGARPQAPQPQTGGEPAAIRRAKQAGLAAKVRASFNQSAADAVEGWHDADGSFNPKGFGGTKWQNGRDRAVAGSEDLFDRQGQVNAWNNKDALIQSQNLLSNTVRQFQAAKQRRNAERQMTAEKKQLIAAAMQSDEGFRFIGQELSMPIKTILDYSGWSRKLLRERVLEQGELFRIPLDVRANAMILAQDGQGVESRAFTRWLTPVEYPIASFPTVAIEELYESTYDLLDRMQNTARQEIELEEDKRVLALIDTAATRVNNEIAFGSLGIGAFEDLRYQVERHRLVVEKFMINRAEQSDIIKTMSGQVDPVTERELILAGFIGNILNCSIVIGSGLQNEEVIPSGTIYAVTGPETLGEFGVRIELFAEPFSNFAQFRPVKGLMFYEKIAPIIVNARSCAKGVKST